MQPTAAHCTYNKMEGDIQVVVGEHNLKVKGEGEQIIPVERITQVNLIEAAMLRFSNAQGLLFRSYGNFFSPSSSMNQILA